MRILVIYDISDNSRRSKLAGRLQSLGLVRIQRSAFAGRGGGEKLKHVARIAKGLIGSDDVVHIILIDEYSWLRKTVLGTPYYLRKSAGLREVSVVQP